jgi:SAM-dependent methyltransferase
MRTAHVEHLACPECGDSLEIAAVGKTNGDRIEKGTLRCVSCDARFEIVRHIPRFIPEDNYARGFGLQWNRHARTQYDGNSGVDASRARFFEETKWKHDLKGEVILEVGSGSGRFTEQAASTGAMVVSLDYSTAVEANYRSNGNADNVLIVQGDIYRMPFRPEAFDKVICIGVLQHTPNVREAFLTLPRYLKSGGSLVIDVYRKYSPLKLNTKYWVRPLTKRMAPERLYAWVDSYVRRMWPIARLIRRLPRGRNLNWKLLIADYGGIYDLDDDTLRDWAILDTFDMLAPAYDRPQTLKTVQEWFEQAELEQIDVHYGFNGIEGRAIKA